MPQQRPGPDPHAGEAAPGPDLRASIERLVKTRMGRNVIALEGIAAGLGARRFLRVRLDAGEPSSLVARIEAPEDDALRPAGVDPEPPLEPLRSFLAEHGIPVPASHGIDSASGIQLLEDLGPISLEVAARSLSPARRSTLYREACAILPGIQNLSAEPEKIAAFGRRLNAPLFRYKAEQVIQWVLPWSLGRPPRDDEARVVREAFELVSRECSSAPMRLSHRDYKAANLHLRSKAEGEQTLVLIDLQGALLAPPEYDLVCLLRDAQVPLTDEEVEEHLEAIRPRLPHPPTRDEFERRFTLLTLTRVGKDLSRFLFAAHQRGDTRYLAALPDATRTLRAAARGAASWDPKLEALARLFEDLPRNWSLARSPIQDGGSCAQ